MRKKRKYQLRNILYVLPLLFLFIVFRYLTIIEGFRLSFVDFDPNGIDKFVGFKHYIKAFNDSNFIDALGRTFLFTLNYVIISVLGALFVASIINLKHFKGSFFFKICYFLPVVTSFSAVAYVMKLILSPDFGPIATMLKMMGKEPILFWGRSLAFSSMVGVNVWKNMGLYMIIFLANLQIMNPNLTEAAHCDGANGLQIYYYVTLPQLKPALGLSIILALVDGFQVFTSILIITDGGPANATESILYYAYVKGFRYFEFSFGAAASVILFVILLFLSLVPKKIFKF